MPEKYLVLINGDEVREAWEADRDRWKKYVIAHYTKMLVKGGLAYAVNHFTLSIGGVIFEGPGLYKTDQHIKRLLEIQSRQDVQKQYPCTCKDAPCSDILLYTIGQKLKKYERRIVGSLPVVGTAETVRAKIGGAIKSERGVKRTEYAKLLHSRADKCLRAQAIVAELLGSYKSQESWKETFSLAEWADGWKVLKEKMAST
jgi:hypothetical protein